jgi:spore coat protein U-like protein
MRGEVQVRAPARSDAHRTNRLPLGARRLCIAIAVGASMLAGSSRWTTAWSQALPACHVDATPVVISSAIDPIGGGEGDSTGSITVTCSGLLSLGGLAVCAKLQPASGRTLTRAGGGSLSYEIYKDAAHTQVWGSTNATGNGYTFTSLIGVNGTRTFTAYARVLGGQSVAAPGTYTGQMDVIVSYGAVSDQLGCNSAGLASTATTSFQISAEVQKSCTVSAGALDFGQTANLSAPLTSTANITARCSNTTPYQIGLGLGANGGSSPASRLMRSGASTIQYGLYRDPGHTVPWGETPNADTLSATGTGSPQAVTVYGRVPAQATPPPGVYKDTVVVSVTY